jgi:RNA recognition motif-containing protein
MSESLQGKLKLIEKFLAPDATPDDLNEREKRAQQVVATCAKYNKASWTVVDETKRPNSSLPAPEGVWGQVRYERPATEIRDPKTGRSRGFGFIEVDDHYSYSMVLTLNRQGHKAIEIPLRDEREKQLAFIAISQASQNTSAKS